MSPDILTLVAAVLVYDLALDTVLDSALLLSARSASRNVRSETRDENDMVVISSFWVNFLKRPNEFVVCTLQLKDNRMWLWR